MRLEIKIEMDNKEEAAKLLAELSASLGGTGSTVVVQQAPEAPQVEDKPKRKGVQTRKSEAVDIPKDEPVVTETETTITEPTLTVAQMQRKLAELKTSKGLSAEKIKAVIKHYGAEKISGIDPSNFNALINDVEAL